MSTAPKRSRGLFRADQLRCGAPYELSDGHAVYVLPAGKQHGSANAVGAMCSRPTPT